MSKKGFYNTTEIKGEELETRYLKALTQDEDVLQVFESMSFSKTLTPEMVLRYLKDTKPEKYMNTPLTSIRRAFSNLKYQGKIEKSKIKTEGDFGMKVNCWKLVKREK